MNDPTKNSSPNDIMQERDRTPSYIQLNGANSLKIYMEGKIQKIVEQFNDQMNKQKSDLRGFKQEMDLYNSTLELISRSIKEQFEEISAVQTYKLEMIELKLDGFQQSIDEKFKIKIQDEKVMIQPIRFKSVENSDSDNRQKIQNEIKTQYLQIPFVERINSDNRQMVERIESQNRQQSNYEESLDTIKSQREFRNIPQEINSEVLIQRIVNVENIVSNLQRKNNYRKDDKLQTAAMIQRLKEDRNLQDLLLENFKEDSVKTFDKGLAPFRILMDTRIANQQVIMQNITLTLKRIERSMIENSETIILYKKEIISIQSNVDKILAPLQEELDKVNSILPQINTVQESFNDQIQQLKIDTNDIKQNIMLIDQRTTTYLISQEQQSIDNSKIPQNVQKEKTNQNDSQINGEHNQIQDTQEHYNNDNYLSNIESQIGQIQRQIKGIKRYPSYRQWERIVSKSVENNNKIGSITKPLKAINISRPNKLLIGSQENTALPKIIEEQNLQQKNKNINMFYPQEKKTKSRSKTPNYQLYSKVISDEDYYQQYQIQIDEIQSKLNPIFEIKNTYRQTPSPQMYPNDDTNQAIPKFNNIYIKQKENEIKVLEQKKQDKNKLVQLSKSVCMNQSPDYESFN